MITRRASGILLHITSLPSPYGIGDMGPEALSFVDFLARSRQGFWQILPVNPTEAERYHSPYEATSAFAGNSLLISPACLHEDGLLDAGDMRHTNPDPASRVDFARVAADKGALLEKAYARFNNEREPEMYRIFCRDNSAWLEDHALFTAMRASLPGHAWWRWPHDLRDRHEHSLGAMRRKLADEIRREKFYQYCFFRQWFRLKRYANERGVMIVGDIPFYVGKECADAWAHPILFKLAEDKSPAFVAGVPPDLFSSDGQLWGNPVYNWARHKDSRYDWWVRRLRHNLTMFDVVRIDHFRGFSAHWEIPVHSPTAATGQWVPGPGADLFLEFCRHFPFPSIIAEDLGLLDADVRELIRQFDFPGMEVLQFAFDDPSALCPYLPHNHTLNSVLYTGTHDNNTLKGWVENEMYDGRRKCLSSYLGRELPPAELPREMIRLAMMSVSRLVIIPMQDILRLGQEARMNRPATLEGNWQWRMIHGEASGRVADELAELSAIYGRA